ncbi:hypothetical protein [Mammaliicoccus vitulinus]|uniref:hypothetical protein n=1 Tax=Mammaliicoccus vitulinus TaxID=71237 RepID=UPI00248C8B4E|nr:hypothetical protein [Mammaliicoccus vitulinus]
MKKILFTLISFVLFTMGVNAAEYTFFNVTAAVTSSVPTCPENAVTLRYTGGQDYSTKNEINFYNITRHGSVYGQSYCLAPSKNMDPNAPHTCERIIAPQKKGRYQASDVAATYAYQLMIKRGIYRGGPSSATLTTHEKNIRITGTIVFRFIESYYGFLDTGGDYASKYLPYSWANRRSTKYWNVNNYNYQRAVEIAEEAIAVGNKVRDGKKTYEQLVKEGTLWADDWEINVVNTKVEGNIASIKFDISAKNGHAPDTILWKSFDITCENGFECVDVDKKKIADSNGGYKGRYIVKVNIENGRDSSKQKFGIKIKTAFQDNRSPSANMFIVDPENIRTDQRMLVIKDYEPSFVIQTELKIDDDSTHNSCSIDDRADGKKNYYGRDGSLVTKAQYQEECEEDDEPEGNEKCECEVSNGRYTGNYKYTKTDGNGKKTTKILSKNDSRVSSLGCPSKCINSCSVEDRTDGKKNYYGKNGTIVTKAQYLKECEEDEPQGTEKCVCEKSDGRYTGNYKYTKTDGNGEKTTEILSKDDPRVSSFGCPSKCINSCSVEDRTDGKKNYYGKNGTIVTKAQYHEECEEEEEPEDMCECETSNGRYTGNYKYTKINEDGEETTEILSKYDSRISSLGCPDKCINNCSIEYELNGKKTYYGKTGSVVDRNTYRSQCLHICQTPDENDDGVYYCNEHETDQGGKKCTEEEYLRDCECPLLKEKCEENPSDPACDEYDEKCPNCNATVSIPGTCNDFDTESEKTGTISDINLKSSDCNDIENPVKQCVIDGEDQTGASYEAKTIIKNNRYCKVWCDESYDFKVPTAQHSTSGGYFTLSTTISGTRNCYVSAADNPKDPIDYELFESDIRDMNEAVTAAYNNWQADPSDENYNLLVEINQEMIDTIDEFNKCSNWTNNMMFDPVVKFTYHEEEYNNIGNGTFTKTGSVSKTINNTYCLGDTNNQYKCLSGALTSNSDAAPSGLYRNITYKMCDNTGCKDNVANVSQAKWISKTVTNSATYVPNQNFSTYHQYGTVQTGTVCAGTSFNNCLWTRLPVDSLPVELKTGKGAFPFVLKFSNIGQYNNTSALGRLINENDNVSVLTEYNELPAEKKCGNTGNNSVLEQESGYVCAYINNCDQCEVSCENGDCNIHEDECENGECEVSCKTCIFDGKSSTYKFRTVTLNDLFPNSCENNESGCRDEGYNWQTLKAQSTRQEIEEQGEAVYEEPEYSYTLTPQQKANIRQFNKSAQTYANTSIPNGEDNAGENALKCEQYVDPNTGLEYSVKCRSTFLSSTSNKYFTANVERPEFTLWLDSNYCQTNGNCVLSKKDGIGPSWK